MSESIEALAEMRKELGKENPEFLKRCEQLADNVMQQYKALGDSGVVAMTFLAVRIASEIEAL